MHQGMAALSPGPHWGNPKVNRARSSGRVHYNYFRSYDSATGRYTRSDPIGLVGGLNTFTYALNSPVRYNDPEGLIVPAIAACLASPPCAAALATGAAATAALIADAMRNSGVWDDFGDAVPDSAADDKPKEPEQCGDDDDDGDGFCEKRYQIELATCRALGRYERGTRTRGGGAAACYASAEARYWACKNKRPEPPFTGWPQY